MVNFFGFYIDPVYILILTVAVISGFLVALNIRMTKMDATLAKILEESQLSEATRVAREAERAVAGQVEADLTAKIAELEKQAETIRKLRKADDE